jgi:hypothetical protein
VVGMSEYAVSWFDALWTINVAVLANSMANIRPKSVIFLIGAVRPGPKYGHARKKTAGYHLFRNVLPECNPILGSQLTAAATQLESWQQKQFDNEPLVRVVLTCH